VVAEGVETEEAFRRLCSLGCDHVQGYLFGPAMAADHFKDWLRTSSWTRAPRTRRTPAPAD
jgi:EAL domain-containing protein (putative c-di-GMP-specific phosphodiesterase class I)